MGDYYDARLEVLGLPALWLKSKERRGYGGETYTEDRLDLSQLSEEGGQCPTCELLSCAVALTDDALAELGFGAWGLSAPVQCALCEHVGEWDRWRLRSECETLSSQLSQLMTGEAEQEWEPYGDGRFGLWSWQESQSGGDDAFTYGILDALEALGLAYYAGDEGAYEWPGSFTAWRPGWGSRRSGTQTQDGPVLTQSDWQSLLARSSSLEEAGQLAGSWFASRAEALELGASQTALVMEGG